MNCRKVVDGRLLCRKCQVWKFPSEFGTDNRKKSKTGSYCKKCDTLRGRLFRAKNKNDKGYKERRRDYFYKKNYGIGLKEVREILFQQGYQCAICPRPLREDKRTHVDHDHLTGKVRGILCKDCNQGLGLFNDNEGLLDCAIEYLQESKRKEYVGSL